MDRRTLLRGGLVGVGGIAASHLVGCAPMPDGPPVDLGVWDCGVASGVHAPGAVVLWTRFAPVASYFVPTVQRAMPGNRTSPSVSYAPRLAITSARIRSRDGSSTC